MATGHIVPSRKTDVHDEPHVGGQPLGGRTTPGRHLALREPLLGYLAFAILLALIGSVVFGLAYAVYLSYVERPGRPAFD